MDEKRIKIRACRQCGAVVTVATDNGEGVDNEQGHAKWHERQDELLAPFQETADVLGKIAVTYWNQVCMPLAQAIASSVLPQVEALGEAIKRAQGEAGQAPEDR